VKPVKGKAKKGATPAVQAPVPVSAVPAKSQKSEGKPKPKVSAKPVKTTAKPAKSANKTMPPKKTSAKKSGKAKSKKR
jgi:hypothetical protein